MKITSDVTQETYNTDKLERECGKVEYNGKTYWLTPQAYSDNYCGLGSTMAVYKAIVIDADGNTCKAIWRIKDGFDGDDEADACDWNNVWVMYDANGYEI
jgi:hypothetical protein